MLTSFINAQTVSIIGRVMDAATSLPISHATVLLVETGEKKVSDA